MDSDARPGSRPGAPGAAADPPRPVEGTPDPSSDHPSGRARLFLVAAFAAVYVIWGSTYLAIRFAIETIPPFTMAGVRFVVAGGALYLWSRALLGRPKPTAAEWRTTAVVGVCLLLVGNGAVVWAEQWVPSGLVALLVATVPFWMVLLDWLWASGERPGPWLVGGLLWGLVGVGLLASAEGLADSLQDLVGGGVVLLGAGGWAVGSIYSRRAAMPSSPRLSTAMQMLVGGLLLLAAGAGAGEWGGLDVGGVSLKSALALLYLIVFGAIVGYTAYIWLLQHTTAARASTYAYVNPVVALFLGWALADEPVTLRTLVAAAMILSAVMLITVRGRPRLRRASRADTTAGGEACPASSFP